MFRSKAVIALLIISILIPGALLFAENETIAITTYYPSPYGDYLALTSRRMKIGTTYSGSGVNVADNNLLVEGNVGIGTTTPVQKLDVNGTIRAQNPWFAASSTDCWRSGSGWINVVHNRVLAGNSGGWYSTANGRFTAPVTGVYIFVASHYIYSSNSGAAYIHHVFGVNGNSNGAGRTGNSGGYTIFGQNMGNYDSSTSQTALIFLNAGDYVNDNVYVSSAANYMCGYHSFFQGALLYAT
ncbi:MAG: complement C1q domain-containing protein [Candidatus Omnitrophica bacterium]|jgi:hypothetical protein|nr:complement C1q domain-containing protein [Candidatus Omnitrophota bacterium]